MVFSFAAPWILTALLGLPVLWLILRITPPAPRTMRFPAIRLLYNLQSREETPDSAPWWLLLLRLLFAALVILAAARPELHVIPALSGSGAVVMVVDNGWAAGRDWEERQRTMESLIAQAERNERNLILLPTSPDPDDQRAHSRPVTPGEAKRLVQAMAPRPWPVDLERLFKDLADNALPSPADVIWLTNGIADASEGRLADRLQHLGSLTIVTSKGTGAKILQAPDNSGRNINVTAVRTAAGTEEPVTVRAIAADGRVLVRKTAQFAADAREAALQISLPIDIRNQVTRLEIEGERTAASVVLLDAGFQRRPVGLIAETGFEKSQPLLDELHYLERALSPFSEVARGPLGELLQAGVSSVILADTGALPQADKTRLADWIDAGGILIRFAGPHLAAASLEAPGLDDDDMVPVRLRGGDRAMGGALSWSDPPTITVFSPDGPFAGMDDYGPVTVRRQVLAEPTIDLDERTWARLGDGTPIVTAQMRGQGWLVLFHTTANPDWSEFAISGLFVDMLKRVVALGTASRDGGEDGEVLPPLETLNGFGELGAPPASARAIGPDGARQAPVIGPRQPPGYYGAHQARRALNLAITPDTLRPEPAPAAGVLQWSYAEAAEIDFSAAAFLAAMILFAADLIITLFMRGHLSAAPRRQAAAPVLAALLIGGAVSTPAPPAHAQAPTADDFALMSSLETRLAYVLTGIQDVDAASEAGLASLSDVLRQRTAIEPAAPIGVRLDRDELAFFPLLYWPIPSDHPPLSDIAADRVNTFMRNGGTVLFDTRDQFEAGLAGGGGGMRRLRALSQALDIPALTPVPSDHVLTKSFYLLDEFPGRYEGGLVWIEDDDGADNSEVTPIIIGSHDWSSAWARNAAGLFAFPVVPGGELQREHSLRFGVNLVMYALTGNYKADQVHVRSILERLGQ